MRLLDCTILKRRYKNTKSRSSSQKVSVNDMALAGAVTAMAQFNHPSAVAQINDAPKTKAVLESKGGQVLESTPVPTCERLDKLIESSLNRQKDQSDFEDTTPMSPPSADELISLLSKLPYEIRLSIYELCIPCMWHRKRKILLDYITDCRWMATSIRMFNETAPLILKQPLLFMYTKMDGDETLAGVFADRFRNAFSSDSRWVLPAAHSMIEKLAVTIRYPDFYRHCQENDLGERLSKYLQDVSAFGNLKSLQISLGPDYIPTHANETFQLLNDWQGEIELCRIRNLRLAAVALQQVIPRTCDVTWRFDKAGMPAFPGPYNESGDLVKYMERINVTMARYWARHLSIEGIANIDPGREEQ